MKTTIKEIEMPVNLPTVMEVTTRTREFITKCYPVVKDVTFTYELVTNDLLKTNSLLITSIDFELYNDVNNYSDLVMLFNQLDSEELPYLRLHGFRLLIDSETQTLYELINRVLPAMMCLKLEK